MLRVLVDFKTFPLQAIRFQKSKICNIIKLNSWNFHILRPYSVFAMQKLFFFLQATAQQLPTLEFPSNFDIFCQQNPVSFIESDQVLFITDDIHFVKFINDDSKLIQFIFSLSRLLYLRLSLRVVILSKRLFGFVNLVRRERERENWRGFFLLFRLLLAVSERWLTSYFSYIFVRKKLVIFIIKEKSLKLSVD